MSLNWHPVGTIEEIKSAPKCAEIAGKELAVFYIEARPFAVSNVCPHRGGPLSKGTIEAGPSVRCPLHGWTFDLVSGACLNMPTAKVDTYPIEERGGTLLVSA